MRQGRYFLNQKGNVPELEPDEEKLLVAILLGILIVAGVILFVLHEFYEL